MQFREEVKPMNTKLGLPFPLYVINRKWPAALPVVVLAGDNVLQHGSNWIGMKS